MKLIQPGMGAVYGILLVESGGSVQSRIVDERNLSYMVASENETISTPYLRASAVDIRFSSFPYLRVSAVDERALQLCLGDRILFQWWAGSHWTKPRTVSSGERLPILSLSIAKKGILEYISLVVKRAGGR
jgi:hypothetical protein